jgi:peptide subunit release factor 1 (eRF1)
MNHNDHEAKPIRQIAVWIDHREAILAIFTDAHLIQEEELFSEAGPHTHGGGWSQQRFDAHRHEMLSHFYKEIAQNLLNADQIILYGPGEAKHELSQYMSRHNNLSERVLDLVTTDKMTDEQFVRIALNDFVTAYARQNN